MTTRVEELRDRILTDLAEAEKRVADLRGELAQMGIQIAVVPRCKNATRNAVIDVLKTHGEMRPREILKYMDVTYEALSQQLSRGQRAGLFCVRRVNGDVFYSLPVPK